jgi:Holliday junction resolvase
MRRAARIDENQEQIVKALRAVGASVQSLAAVGHGVPDLLVGYQGKNILIEIKDGNKTPSKRKLTDDQVKWHESWNGGAVAVVESVDAAWAALGIMRGNA